MPSRLLERQSPRYRVGRVFLVGDAHVHSANEGQRDLATRLIDLLLHGILNN